MENKEMYVSALACQMLKNMGEMGTVEREINNKAQQFYNDVAIANEKAQEVIEQIRNAGEGMKQFNGWNRLYGSDAEKEIEQNIKNNWDYMRGITRIKGRQRTIPYGFYNSIRKTLDNPESTGFATSAQQVPRRITQSMYVTTKHQKHVIPMAWILNEMFDANFESKLNAKYNEALWEDMADLFWNGNTSGSDSLYKLQDGVIKKIKATAGSTKNPEGTVVYYTQGGQKLTANKIAADVANTSWTYAKLEGYMDKCINVLKENVETRHYLNKRDHVFLMNSKHVNTFSEGRMSTYANDGSSNLAANTEFRERLKLTGDIAPYRGYQIIDMPYFPEDVILFVNMKELLLGYQTEIMRSRQEKPELSSEDAVLAGEGAGTPGVVINVNYYIDFGIANPDSMSIVYYQAKCETPVAFDSNANVSTVVTAGAGTGALVVYPYGSTPGCELYADDATISDTYATAVAATTKVASGTSYSIADEATGYFKCFKDGVALPSTQLTIVNES